MTYTEDRMKEFAMNIDEFSIGQTVFDKRYNVDCVINNKTINSIEVAHKKVTDKGINCLQWYDMRSFNNRFKTKD